MQKRPTMHDEGEDIMETINWLVAGKNSMEMHGYTNSDSGNDPYNQSDDVSVRDVDVHVQRHRRHGSSLACRCGLQPSRPNRISVSARQVFDKRDKQQSKGKVAQVKTFDVTGFDKGFKVNWE